MKLNNKNTYYELIIFSVMVLLANFIYCYLYINKFPNIVDVNNNFILEKLGFNFSEIMSNLLSNGSLEATYFDTTYYVSRMPLIPFVLKFLYSFISTNFYIIHLIKNLFFWIIIFFLLKKTFKDQVLFYISLILIFIIPHNLWTSLSFNFEEGILNYLIIILFLLLISDIKFKVLFVGLVISLLFLLKSSMFFLCMFISLYFLYYFFKLKKKLFLVPFISLFFFQILWGYYSFIKTDHFAFGTKSVSFNAFTLKHAYNNEFIKIYPEISPDTLTDKLIKILPESIEKDEWKINQFYFDSSIEFLKENPDQVLFSFLKKINVVMFYPYKDSQFPNENGVVEKKIRPSNIPNKIIFIFSLYVLFTKIFKKKKNIQTSKEFDFLYLFILIFYFFPYMVGFIYTRHCTAIYMISIIYVLNNYRLSSFLVRCKNLIDWIFNKKYRLFKFFI